MCRKLTLKDKALHHDCDRGDGGGKPGALNNWWTGRNEGWQAEGQSSEEVDEMEVHQKRGDGAKWGG